MISDALQHLTGTTMPGIVGLVLLLLGFIGIIVWAIRLDRSHVDHMSQLPLESDDHANSERGVTHG